MIEPLILTLIIIGAVALFAYNGMKLVKLVQQGGPDDRFGQWDKRIMSVIIHVFGHKRLLDRKLIGISHALFFYGFLIIQVCALEIFGKIYNPDFSYAFLGPLYPLLMAGQDILCFGVFVAIGYGTYRRLVAPPKHLVVTADGWIILGLIFGVVATIYLIGGAEIALGHRDEVKWAMPFEAAMGSMMSGMSADALHGVLKVSLWAHVLIVLGFLNYLPSSKHLHLLGAVPNIFFAKLGPKAALSTPNLEDENLEVFGASEPKHFSWKHLLDTTACTECGRCTSHCPAQATGKPLSPMKIIHDLKLAMFDTAPVVLAEDAEAAEKAAQEEVTPLIEGRTSLDELWACTTCGACVEACPVLIEHVDDIVDMRRNLVLMESRFPEEIQATFTALENEGNPWGLPAGSRGDWTEKVEVKVLGEGESTPLLYWVGCAGACDDRSKKVTQSVVKILNAAGVDYAVLAAQESCTGDPARRLGNEYLYQMLAQQNIETLNSHNITKIITQCPHCFNTLANEYPDLGGKYEVMHHSEFIQQLLDEDRIKISENGKEKITFHDPCYLGRWNGKIDEPRNVIDSLPNRERVEMERSGRTSFCCGAGGGRMWMEEHIGKQVNAERSQEAIGTGANTIAVGCPFCMTMMEDGVKTEGKDGAVRVRDLAELVAEAMEETEPSLPAGASS